MTYPAYDEVQTGIPLLDRQHDKYFQAVGQLMELCKTDTPALNDIRRVMNDILDYAVDNFDTEELLMDTEQYPEYDKHKAKHDGFKDKLDSHMESLSRQTNLKEIAERLKKLLVNWFLTQIRDDDMKLAAFLKKRRRL